MWKAYLSRVLPYIMLGSILESCIIVYVNYILGLIVGVLFFVLGTKLGWKASDKVDMENKRDV